MRPVAAGSPFSSLRQVAPPSLLLKMPPRSLPSVSAVPYVNDQGVRRRAYRAAYSTLGLAGSMATSPAPTRSS